MKKKRLELLKKLLKDGELLSYGAKSLPEGGYFSMPKLFTNGALLIGDSAGFLNGMRLRTFTKRKFMCLKTPPLLLQKLNRKLSRP